MNTPENIHSRLTSAEVSSLWNSYLLESMVHHIFVYFSNIAEDKEIKSHIDYDIEASRDHIEKYIAVLAEEGIPIPRGTTSEDINAKAPRLYTDQFCITYIKSLAKFALTNSVMAYTEGVRSDVRQLFRDYIIRLIKVEQDATDIMIAKDMLPSPPAIHVPKDIEFIEDGSFFRGYFGEKRSLSATEIKLLYNNTHSNELGKALLLGFVQVAQDKKIKDYFRNGIEISEKFIKSYSDKLLLDEIAPAPSMHSEVLSFKSTDSPFSDRLMLNHIVLLNAYGIGNYAMAMAQSQRYDLNIMYGKDIAEVGLYAKNGAELLVQNKWLEQPPVAQ